MSESRVRRWALTSARVAVGTAIAGVAVVAVGAGIALPWPQVSATPVRVEAVPAPADSTLVCDGPLLALGRTVEQAGQLSVAAPQDVVSGPVGSDSRERALTGPTDGSPVALTAPPVDRALGEIAASGSSVIADADIRGFTASACTPPLMESWLVGGATTTGSNDLVVLANPGDVAATVQLTVYGAQGGSTPPGGRNRVVAPGAQIVVPLPGLLRDEESPVVQVTSSGAPVRASLQSSLIRVLTPGGVDQVGAIAAASSRAVIPDVPVLAEPDGENPSTIVRLLASHADGEAVVTVRPVGGSAASSTSAVPLVAGVPSTLELGDLTPGRYSITIDATIPVVAAAWEATGFSEGSDFAWFPAAPEIGSETLFAVPRGPSPRLTVANPGAEEITVTLVPVDGGESTSIAVPAGSSTSVDLEEATVYRLTPSAPVHASTSFSAADALAGFAIWPPDAAVPPITVFP